MMASFPRALVDQAYLNRKRRISSQYAGNQAPRFSALRFHLSALIPLTGSLTRLTLNWSPAFLC
jgi:hypothetical protein